MTEPAKIVRVREIYEQMRTKDLDSIMDGVTDDIEYRNPEFAMEAGVRRGRSEFRIAIESITATFDFLQVSVARWAARENEVLVAVRSEATGEVSGAPIDRVFGHHFVFEGEKVRSFAWFNDWDTAAAAAGFDLDTWEHS